MSSPKQEKPLVSLCIPIYNGEKYLDDALESALVQTYRPLEIIVSDDNSTDRSLDIVSKYEKKSDISFFIYHHKPAGIGANWNNCIKQANGEFIKFLFQDDILLPNCIEEMIRLTQLDENIGLVFSERILLDNINDNWSKQIIKKNSNLFPEWLNEKEVVIDGRAILKRTNLFEYPQNIFGEPTAALINIKTIQQIGLFSEKLNQKLDTEYWLRACSNFKIVFYKKKLVKFRINTEQATKQNSMRKGSKENIYFYKSMIANLFFSFSLKIGYFLVIKYLRALFVYFIRKI